MLTVKEVAEKLNVHDKTVYGWLTKGCPTVIKQPVRLDLNQVIEWLNQRRSKQ